MMKKLLLGGTAIAGTIALALPAHAGETMSGDNYTVTLGGRYDYSIQYYSQDISAGHGRGYQFTGDEAEIYVKAKATADNGITYGVNIELNANTDDGSASDEIYGIVENQDVWGRLELGDNDSASDRMYVAAEDILAGRAGWDASEYGGNLAQGNALITSDNSLMSDATKLIYFSPRFAGFQVGVSHTPDRGCSGNCASELDNNGSYEKVWSFGANWEGEFNDVGIIVSGTYETGDSEPNTSTAAASATNGGTTEEDLKVWAVGANVTFGGFAVGAGYVDFNDSGLTSAQKAAGRDAGKYYNVGAAYGTGPWKVSIGYYHSKIGNTAPASDTKTNFYVLGGTYKVAPGWRIDADFDVVNIDNQNGGVGAAALDNDYRSLVLTNRFDF